MTAHNATIGCREAGIAELLRLGGILTHHYTDTAGRTVTTRTGQADLAACQ